MKLILGVNDVPEWNSKARLPDVAQRLENKYGLFSEFAEAHLNDIASDLLKSANGALGNMLAGGPLPSDPLLEGCSKITARFQTFLDTGEIETLGVPGTPTKAALQGVNRRFKKKKGPRRPSFVETATLRQNLQTWTEP